MRLPDVRRPRHQEQHKPSVTASVPTGATVLWDKTAAGIQSDVSIAANNVITGTLTKVASWPGAGFDPAKGTHFLAIHFKADTGYSLKTECVPSQGQLSASFTDDDAVGQITADTKAIRCYVYKSGSDDPLYYVDYPLNVTLGS